MSFMNHKLDKDDLTIFLTAETVFNFTGKTVEAFYPGDKILPNFTVVKLVRSPISKFWKPKYSGLIMKLNRRQS